MINVIKIWGPSFLNQKELKIWNEFREDIRRGRKSEAHSRPITMILLLIGDQSGNWIQFLVNFLSDVFSY